MVQNNEDGKGLKFGQRFQVWTWNIPRIPQNFDIDSFVKWSYNPHSDWRNVSNCVREAWKFRTSTRFRDLAVPEMKLIIFWTADKTSSKAMTLTIVNAISAIAWRVIKISGRWIPEFSRLLYAIANKNCVHNCEEHNFTWFHILSSKYSPTSIKRPPAGLWKVAA